MIDGSPRESSDNLPAVPDTEESPELTAEAIDRQAEQQESQMRAAPEAADSLDTTKKFVGTSQEMLEHVATQQLDEYKRLKAEYGQAKKKLDESQIDFAGAKSNIEAIEKRIVELKKAEDLLTQALAKLNYAYELKKAATEEQDSSSKIATKPKVDSTLQ